jgi:hypothetical protein
MSILSKMWDAIIGGSNPTQAVSTAVNQIDQWGAAVLAKAPAAVQADITQAVTDLKGVASAALTAADTLAVPIINTAATAAGAAFTGAVTAYLGPVASAALTPAGLDAIAAMKNGIINELNALELEMQAALAGTVSGTPVANPPGAS